MYRHVTITWLILAAGGIMFLFAGLWIPAKAIVAQHLLHQSWQKSLISGEIVKPWPWADTWPVGRLRNNRLGIDLIILEGESGEVLAFGPGHLPKSSLPGGKGHCILAGHRDTSFQFLRELVAGDILLLEGKRGTKSFTVMTTEVAPAERLYFDMEQLGVFTLVTCFPFDALIVGGPLRYVVSARSFAGRR